MLWPYQRDTGWEFPVDLSRVATPIEQCIMVPRGPVDPEVVAVLKRNGFDQAPVGSQHLVLGIVETARLCELVAEGRPLELPDPAVTFPKLEVVSPLHEVLGRLGEHRAAIVVFDTGERDADPYEYIGLVTISDLDRHAFRSVIYSLLAELETVLAHFVDREFTDPWDWVRLLAEDHQAIVLGHWELAKRKGVDVGPIAATTLTNLLTVVAKSERLRELLGFPSKSQVDKVCGGVPDLRNRVMHPVRPIILDREGVEELRLLLDRVIDLTSRVVSAEASTAQFVDDDTGYLRWTQRHPSGFVVNADRQPRPGYLVLHRATCPTITGTPARGSAWTKDYIKVCAVDGSPLERWAKRLGGSLRSCGRCRPWVSQRGQKQR